MKRVFILSSLFYTALASQSVWIQKEGTEEDPQYKLYGDGLMGNELGQIDLLVDCADADPAHCKTNGQDVKWPDGISAINSGRMVCARGFGNNFEVLSNDKIELIDMGTCPPIKQDQFFQVADESTNGNSIFALSLPTTIDIVGNDCPDVWDNTLEDGNGNEVGGWVTDYKKCGTAGTLCKRQSAHQSDSATGNFNDDCSDKEVVHTDGQWDINDSACTGGGSDGNCWDSTIHSTIPQITRTCQGRQGNGNGCDGNAKDTVGFKDNGVVENVVCTYTKTTHEGKCAIDAVYGAWTGGCPCAADVSNPPTQVRTCTEQQFGGEACDEAKTTQVCPDHDPTPIPCGSCHYADNCQRKADGSLEQKDTLKSVNGNTDYWTDPNNKCDCTGGEAMGTSNGVPYSELTCNV